MAKVIRPKARIKRVYQRKHNANTRTRAAMKRHWRKAGH